MKAVDTVSGEEIKKFLNEHLGKGRKVRTDAFPSMNAVKEDHEHEKKVTPPDEASTWLPLVHIVIGNHCCPVKNIKNCVTYLNKSY